MPSLINPEHRIQSQWDDESHSIIRVSHLLYWTWEELHRHEQQVIAPMLRSARQPVSLLVDMRGGPFFDPTATSEQVRQTGEMHRVLPLELVVFVLRDMGTGTLLKVLHERYGAPNGIYRVARTLDEARAMIRDYRLQEHYSAYVRPTDELRQVDSPAGD
ncbi:MAG: hypothetical protein U0694_22290 [Anaerolineae bacterium]